MVVVSRELLNAVVDGDRSETVLLLTQVCRTKRQPVEYRFLQPNTCPFDGDNSAWAIRERFDQNETNPEPIPKTRELILLFLK